MLFENGVTLAFRHLGLIHKSGITNIYGIYFILMSIPVLAFYSVNHRIRKAYSVPYSKRILSVLAVFLMITIDLIILLKRHSVLVS